MYNFGFSELEKISANVTSFKAPPNLGNSSMLSLDPTLDRSSVYDNLLTSYKRTNKVIVYEKGTLLNIFS